MWYLESAGYVTRNLVSIKPWQKLSYQSLSKSVMSHIKRGHLSALAPLNPKCCNFESKYFRSKAFLDVASAETGDFQPRTPIWVSQLKTNVNVPPTLTLDLS